ncbi:acyl-CoA dehydrogenase family protein [Bradyrhizobium sp. RT5a]|uniref:acyl-CoA dehydrogenase family protein n=1 Tax=unclassified Bradyrhizobium TaxID=2631580 RepID=UPI0033934A3B
MGALALFRDEVRAFCRSAIPADILEKLIAGRHPSKDDKVRWTRILAQKGWAVPHWPIEYGGKGCSRRPSVFPKHEASMSIVVMRDDAAPSGSMAGSRMEGSHRNMRGPTGSVGLV